MDTFISDAQQRAGLLSGTPSYTEDFKKTNDIDAELEEILSTKKATIRVVGVGGAGNNSATRIHYPVNKTLIRFSALIWEKDGDDALT